ncbi:MAG: MurR/RpiR family transcriptional regulator [Lachnospiraceae bacterium]|nr:MurR/RpiR family transcriptional regulator [Lachnospiraceae bacterium]
MNIFEEVYEKYETLSTTQQRIADYMFTYPDEVCFLSLKDLSETLGVTEVTILRFVKKAGFASFVDLKKRLREHLQARLGRSETWGKEPGHQKKYEIHDLDKEVLLQKFIANEHNVIQNTYSRISLEQIQEASSIIKQAQSVYVVGSEITSSLSMFFTRRLMTVGIRTMDLGNISRALYSNYMCHINPEDAVVIFSTPGYPKFIHNTARYLLKRHVPMILVTDKLSAPAAAHATVVLSCDNHDLFYYNSILGMTSAAGLLAYFVAMHDAEDTKRLRSRLAGTREEIGSGVFS